MISNRDKQMGRFSVEFDVSNLDDVGDARRGILPPERVRHARLSGLVDTGATRLVLPERVATALGLPKAGETRVKYADGREATRDKVTSVYLEMLGRSGIFTAVVEPDRQEALIGAIVLEDLDLLPDCMHHRLVPRDPNIVISELE
jgi:predicted aspartyl protease